MPVQKEPEEPVYIRIPLHTPTEEDLKSGVIGTRQDLEKVFGREVNRPGDIPSNRSRKPSDEGSSRNVRVQKKSPPSDGIRIPLHGPPVKQEDIMKVFESCSRPKNDDSMKLKSDSVRIPVRTMTPEDLSGLVDSRKIDFDKSKDYIHISLHTPPHEKPADCFTKVKIADGKKVAKAHKGESNTPKLQKTDRIDDSRSKEVPKKQTKCRRIPLPDGSIRIPLRSPSDEEVPAEVSKNIEPEPEKPDINFDEVIKQVKEIQLKSDLSRQQVEEKVSSPQEEKKKTKKRLVFTTKLGSREEQVFSTQFSLSKTESQCSQPASPEDQKASTEPSIPPEETKIPCTSPPKVAAKPARKMFLSKRTLAQQILDYERDRVKTEDELLEAKPSETVYKPAVHEFSDVVNKISETLPQQVVSEPLFTKQEIVKDTADVVVHNGARKKEFVKTDSFQQAMRMTPDDEQRSLR